MSDEEDDNENDNENNDVGGIGNVNNHLSVMEISNSLGQEMVNWDVNKHLSYTEMSRFPGQEVVN